MVGKNLLISEQEQEEWDCICEKMQEASSFVGNAIKLGSLLDNEGFGQIRAEYVPMLQDVLGDQCQPRVISGYATVLWFTAKVRLVS